MKRLKVLSIILAFCMIGALLAGCTTTEKKTEVTKKVEEPAKDSKPAAESAAKKDESAKTGSGKKIGVASQWLGNDWNINCSDGIKKYLQSKGYEVVHTNGMGKTSQQVADVENFISMKVDGIIVAGGEGGAFHEVSMKAKEARIPLVGVDMFLPGAITGVEADNFSGGVQMGLYMVNKMQGKGKVIILDTPGWQSLFIRAKMAKGVFEEYKGIKVLNTYEVGVDDPVNQSYNIVKSALKKEPDIKGVLCTWGVPAIGAHQAIEELGLQKQIVIANADTDKAVLELMAAKGAPNWAMMGQNSRALGERAAKILDSALVNGVNTAPFGSWGPTYSVCAGDPTKDFSVIEYTTIKDMWTAAFGNSENPFK